MNINIIMQLLCVFIIVYYQTKQQKITSDTFYYIYVLKDRFTFTNTILLLDLFENLVQY